MRSVFVSLALLISFESLESARTFLCLRYVSAVRISVVILTPDKLVVIGDQSSGKSSLLEGLTGLSFPIASDLCTRFATQIVLRRAPANEAAVRITIIPGPDAQGDEEALDSLLGFGRTVPLNEFDSQRFQDVFDEVFAH
jgi:GTPase SAR1 family protein